MHKIRQGAYISESQKGSRESECPVPGRSFTSSVPFPSWVTEDKAHSKSDKGPIPPKVLFPVGLLHSLSPFQVWPPAGDKTHSTQWMRTLLFNSEEVLVWSFIHSISDLSKENYSIPFEES